MIDMVDYRIDGPQCGYTVPMEQSLNTYVYRWTPEYMEEMLSVGGAPPAMVVQGATPAWEPVADVVVASDGQVTDLVTRSLGENADVWRRLADL
jgi:hypothetical protein